MSAVREYSSFGGALELPDEEEGAEIVAVVITASTATSGTVALFLNDFLAGAVLGGTGDQTVVVASFLRAGDTNDVGGLLVGTDHYVTRTMGALVVPPRCVLSGALQDTGGTVTRVQAIVA